MDRWHHQDTRFANYKLADLDDCTAHDLVIRACDVGVVPNRTIPEVLREWWEPRHAEFEPRNIWSLFNAFTEVLKGNLIELPAAPKPSTACSTTMSGWPCRHERPDQNRTGALFKARGSTNHGDPMGRP